MKKTALAVALGVTVVPQMASAVTMEFNWVGNFTMLDANGAALGNTSITTKGANTYQTTVTGTMAFDTVTGAGTATLNPFDFYAGTAPAEAVGINMQAIGDGQGNAGTLVMGNMLFNWNGSYGIPVSIVMDAAGFFGATSAMWNDGVLDQSDVAGFGALPASDGTYINLTFGYLGVGPVPMATTEWNVSPGPGCTLGDCMNVGTSGVLPLVMDTSSNFNKYAMDDNWPAPNQGIGGIPMWDGSFQGFNANFDILSLTMTSADAGYTIPANCDFGIPCEPTVVPVPAAVWLFGSGLLGLVGVARRKKQA